MKHTKRFSSRLLPGLLGLIALISVMSAGAVSAEGEEAAITNGLMTSGIAVMSVTTSGSVVTVEYEQPVAEVDTVIDVLLKVGTVFSTVAVEMPSARDVVVIQYFDDGQIMEITGAPQDGVAFVNQQLSAEQFMDRLAFRPLTRGPLMVPGECEPTKGENCRDNPECGCYPGETCDPSSPQANEWGCVLGAAPANSHLVGSQYVCNDGYEWSSDLFSCVPVKQCPPNAFAFDGDCHCEAGYEWNATGTECVPVQNTTTAGTGGTGGGTSGGSDPGANAQDVASKLKTLLDSLVSWIKSLFGG
jgi:hypothetical protein